MVSPDYRAAIELVKQARIDQGLSQRELARRLEKPPSFVNKIEFLERRLDIVEFIAIARALGLSPGVFIQGIAEQLPAKLAF